jgi:hypothetical protein
MLISYKPPNLKKKGFYMHNNAPDHKYDFFNQESRKKWDRLNNCAYLSLAVTIILVILTFSFFQKGKTQFVATAIITILELFVFVTLTYLRNKTLTKDVRENINSIMKK